MTSAHETTQLVKELAVQCGFAAVGVAPADAGPELHRQRYRNWLSAGRHASMHYLARNEDIRFNPSRLVDNARSVICLAVSYAPAKEPQTDAFIARYARGRDYHKVLKKRSHALADQIRRHLPQFEGRAFVDSAPLSERSLAARAGLGWIGRNGCLIVPGLGSYVLLAEIVCNLELEPDEPLAPLCGDCRACLAACPSQAILDDGTVDCGRCLSYLTIEHEGEIDAATWPAMGSRVFGCDSCQQACPHNKGRCAGDEELAGQRSWSLAEILHWNHADWDANTAGRALRRCGYLGLLRNAVIAAGNGDAALVEPLERLASQVPELAHLAKAAVARIVAGR